MRPPGTRLPEAAARSAATAAALSVMRPTAHVADRGAPGKPRHPARAGAVVGLVAANPAALAAGRRGVGVAREGG